MKRVIACFSTMEKFHLINCCRKQARENIFQQQKNRNIVDINQKKFFFSHSPSDTNKDVQKKKFNPEKSTSRLTKSFDHKMFSFKTKVDGEWGERKGKTKRLYWH